MRGISTIIGALLFLTMMLAFLGLFYALSLSLDEYYRIVSLANTEEWNRVREDIVISNIYLENSELVIELYNKGGITARIVSLWINDEFRDLMKQYIYIEPGRSYKLSTGLTPTLGRTYTLKVVTERGNIVVDFHPRPVHVGQGYAEVPGGAGAARLSGAWAAGRLKSLEVAVLENVGSVPFKINFLTRIVLVSEADGKCYSGYLTEVNGTKVGPTLPALPDSMWIYPGNVVTLTFRMVEELDSGYYYYVYLHLIGYDSYGNFYTQSIYLGRYYLKA